MTSEEAIAILEEEAEFLYGEDKPHNRTAFDMAIKALSIPEREKGTQTVWEQWCEELKKCGKDLANKKCLICNCGLYDMECTNKGNGKKCPLFTTKFCGSNYIEADKYLESEVKPNETDN